MVIATIWKWIPWIIAALMVLSALILLPYLPATITTHWNIDGVADRSEPADTGVFVLPVIALALAVLFSVIPHIEVFKDNLKSFETQYWQMASAAVLLMAILWVLQVLVAFGFSFNMTRVTFGLIGLLFLVIAYLMPSFKRSFFVGIRTPWTLSSDIVWKKTHEFGSKVFALGGVIFVASVFLPVEWNGIVIAAVVVLALVPVVYSYLEYRKNPKNEL